MKPLRHRSSLGALSIAALLAVGLLAAETIAQAKAKPKHPPVEKALPDPMGFSKYITTYDADAENALQEEALNPPPAGKEAKGTYAEVRFKSEMGGQTGFGFFHGAEKRMAVPENPKGLQLRMNDLFHDRFAAQASSIRNEISENNAELRETKKWFNDFEETWKLNRPNDSLEQMKNDWAKNADYLARTQDKKALEFENSKNKVRISRIGRELENPTNLNERIKKSTKLFSELMELALVTCPKNANLNDGLMVECQGQSALALKNKMHEIKVYDESLQGTYAEGLQLGPLFGEVKLETSDKLNYLYDNYLLSLFGVKSFGCYNKTSETPGTADAPFCDVVLDEGKRDPIRLTELALEKNAALSAAKTEGEKLDSKAVAAEVEKAQAQLDEAKKETELPAR